MKTTHLFPILLLLTITSFLFSCKKKKETMIPAVDNTEEIKAFVDYRTRYLNYYEETYDEIDRFFSGYNSVDHSGLDLNSICGATIDTSLLSSQKKIIFNYTNSTCGEWQRTGKITLKINFNNGTWNQTNSVTYFGIIELTFENLTVTHTTVNKSVQYNGTLEVSKEDGLISALGVDDSVFYRFRATFPQLVFDNSFHTSNWGNTEERYYKNTTQGLVQIPVLFWTQMTIYSPAGLVYTGGFFSSKRIYCPSSAPKWKAAEGSDYMWVTGNDYGIITMAYGYDGNGSPQSGCTADGMKISWYLSDKTSKETFVKAY